MKFIFIPNTSGLLDYAVFPNILHKLCSFTRAPVRLQLGNQRFGLKHIEIRHQQELQRLGMTAVEFVSELVKPGSPIYCEFEDFSQYQKTQTVNLRIGTAVLAYKPQGDYYTILTAFSRRQAIGEMIGRLQ
jgi:hypothetical protein